MTKIKKVVLITTSFPYGGKEPLISAELPFLREKFDEISIICYTKKKEQKNSELKGDESVYEYDVFLSAFQKLIGLFILNWRLVFKEFRIINKTFGLPINVQVIKVLIMSLIRGAYFERFLKSNFKNDLASKEIIFYSWWCTEEVIGLSSFLNKNKNVIGVTRMHAYDLYFERHSPHYLPLRDYIFSSLNKVFVITNQGYKYLEEKMGVQYKSVLVSRLGVSNHLLVRERSKASILTVVSCSSLIPLKRIELIIESLALISLNTKVKWIHFGTGPEEEALIDLAKIKLRNINFEFYGTIDNKDLHTFYYEKGADLFINVSETEGLPISLMEAMSHGIPCIGTDVGGVLEIIDNNENGYLIDKDFEPKCLARILDEFSEMDEDKRNELRSKAYDKWNENFNSEKNYTSMIKEMVK